MKPLDNSHPCYGNPNVLKEISKLDLSVRARNCLMADKIYYVGDLITLSEMGIRKIPNVGRITVNEINEVLQHLDLQVGVVSSSPLKSLDDIKAFYGVNTEPQAEQKISSDNHPLSMTVSLPETLVGNLTDGKVITKIKPRCQRAFIEAVRAEAENGLAKITQPYKLSLTEINDAAIESHAGLNLSSPTGALRQFIVALEEPFSLNVEFKKAFLDRVARDISGVTLYPALSPLFTQEPS